MSNLIQALELNYNDYRGNSKFLWNLYRKFSYPFSGKNMEERLNKVFSENDFTFNLRGKSEKKCPEAFGQALLSVAEFGASNMFLSRMVYIYLYTIFDSCLQDFLFSVYKYNIHFLKSNKQIKWDDLLQFNTLDEIHETLITNEVREFSYLSIKQQCDYLKKKFNLTVLNDDALIQDMELRREIRNLLVHNKSIVSKDFKKKYPHFPLNENDLILLLPWFFGRTFAKADNFIDEIYNQLCKKFN